MDVQMTGGALTGKNTNPHHPIQSETFFPKAGMCP